MDERTAVQQQIDTTSASMVEKLETLEDRMRDKVRDVKEALTLEHQVEERPWLMVGLAMAGGFVVSRLLFPPVRRYAPDTILDRNREHHDRGIGHRVLSMVGSAVVRTAVGALSTALLGTIAAAKAGEGMGIGTGTGPAKAGPGATDFQHRPAGVDVIDDAPIV
jgi:hypothetical protein